MGVFITIFFLEFLLMIGCHGRPLNVSNVQRFTMNGHNFQISILTTPMSDVEDKTETETETPSPVTTYAVINEVPLHDAPVKLHKELPAFNKMKKVYEEFGALLRLHENEMLSLLDNKANENAEEPKSRDGGIRVRINSGENTKILVPEIGIPEEHNTIGDYKDKSEDNLNIQVHAEPPLRMHLGYPKKPDGNKLSPISGRISNKANENAEEPKSRDGGIRVRISSDENTKILVPEIGIPEERNTIGDHKDKSEDNLNIQVHAEPPLRMHLGYPKKPDGNKLSPISGRLSIYPRGMQSSQAALDSPNESTVNESPEQGLPTEEESFLRRGSELLLSMWKRYHRKRNKSTPDDQQRQNFDEVLVN